MINDNDISADWCLRVKFGVDRYISAESTALVSTEHSAANLQ